MNTLKKIASYCIHNILITTVLLSALFFGTAGILALMRLQFRIGIMHTAIAIICILAITGFVQVLFHLKNAGHLVALTIALIAVIIMSFPLWYICGVVWFDKEETIVSRDGIKMVAREESFLGTAIDYFEYHGPILCGKTALITETYGGGFNPDDEYLIRCSVSSNMTDRGNRYSSSIFFDPLSDKYEYQVKELLEENTQTVPVSVSLLSTCDDYSIYSIDIMYDDCPGRYYNDVTDRFNMGKFLINKDGIYLLMDYQGKEPPTENEFIENGIFFNTWLSEDREINGLKVSTHFDGEPFVWEISGNGYNVEYKWDYHQGLKYFRSVYGAEENTIEIYR